MQQELDTFFLTENTKRDLRKSLGGRMQNVFYVSLKGKLLVNP